jgi:very-short-patch-repair endonuclease
MSARDLHVDNHIGSQRANGAADEVIARIANRQGGVVSRAQLLARGITARSIQRRLESGRLRVIYRSVYAVGHDAIPIRGRLCAALLVAGPGSALSHRTAAHVLALLPSMPPFVEITTTQRRRANRPGLVFHHATTLPTTKRHGLPTTTPIRTLLDLATTHPHDLERATSEALVLKLVTEHQLKTQQGPGSKHLRRLIVGPTRSRFERAFLKAVVKARLPEPLTGHRIGPYTVDFFWPSHDLVVETDGDPYHDNVLARRRDAKKTAYLTSLGYTVLRPREVDLAAVETILSAPATRRAS